MNSYNSEILDLEKKVFTNFVSFFDKNVIQELKTEIVKIIDDETDSYTKRDHDPLIKSKVISDRVNNPHERPYHHSN